ncbi:MAG: S8 family peptidase [Candidatus Choladocola sp.]|nr:S8 family peptidase [Candidatus Choladocola sp.]
MAKSDIFSCQISEPSPTVSEEYSDIIFRYQVTQETLLRELSRYAPQVVDAQYSILHAPLSAGLATVEEIGYSSVPKLFTFVDTVSLEAAGILAVQLQPYLNLRGNGVLIGFLDSGINYSHPAFRNPDGTTRILRLWDQTDQSGTSPAGMNYGSEYTEDMLNEALFSPDSSKIVPQNDPYGHGTAVAGIACGSPDSSADFTGAAPESKLLFVKLKPAKKYLRDYFMIPANSIAYQESDLMLGVRYLVNAARELRMPLVICITLGTNQGGHTGSTPLEDVLTSAQFYTGVYVVAGTGNEVGKNHHYFGQISRVNEYTDVELLVGEETAGFTIEFWADTPELYSVGFTSPLGETIEPIQPRNGTSREIDFLLEYSKIYLTYSIVEMLSGAQLVQMRFQAPTEGLWRIRIVNRVFITGNFHLWLPVTDLVDPSVTFYSPNVNTTLVTPSCARAVITTGTFNAFANSLYASSGRGYTRDGIIKPDFVTPGVKVTCPAGNGQFSVITGSCAASAIAAGATALLVESGLRLQTPRYYTTREIKSLFLRGAGRSSSLNYPNREWGYGTMNLYGTFESFLRS